VERAHEGVELLDTDEERELACIEIGVREAKTRTTNPMVRKCEKFHPIAP
jgi:hypothetical protein